MASRTELEEPTRTSYKYQWARLVSRNRLEEDFNILRKKLAKPGEPLPRDVPALLERTENSALTGRAPESPGHFKVGIIGAGCAGLFTAMILDHLRQIDGIDIDYEILEAADEERLGGRLYTHRFSEHPHDYYDVGAMRFPKLKNGIMDRTFKLFDLLDINEKNGSLIPYYFADENEVCPSYYNDIQKIGPVSGEDPYKLNKGLPRDDQIRSDLIKQDPGKVMDYVLKKYKDQVQNHLDGLKGAKTPASRTDEGENGEVSGDKSWIPLEHADFMSTRQFLRSENNPMGPFNFNTIEWLETFEFGTGFYDQALTETVLESLDFDKDASWYCILGGTQQVARKMVDRLRNKPKFNHQVTAIKSSVKSDIKSGKMSLTIKQGNALETETRDYFAVFNSTTLGALQRMDLSKAELNYGTKQAIRSLRYGASCKVGMKFKSPWWELPPYNINKGGLGKTDLPLRVCVYPSYNLNTPKDEPAVLLCSYTWGQDAQRLGTLISRSSSPDAESELRDVLFHNLALLHGGREDEKKYAAALETIKREYITHHAHDWYQDERTAGAFAYFGPGQFSRMWPEIMKQDGWLFSVGEAASAHHAWIVGALESAVRAVYQMLNTLLWQKQDYEPYRKAMELLRKEGSPLPFSPLPKEMPDRPKGVERGTETGDLPSDGKPLSFTAQQVRLSFCEKVVQGVEEEAGKKGT